MTNSRRVAALAAPVVAAFLLALTPSLDTGLSGSELSNELGMEFVALPDNCIPVRYTSCITTEDCPLAAQGWNQIGDLVSKRNVEACTLYSCFAGAQKCEGVDACDFVWVTQTNCAH